MRLMLAIALIVASITGQKSHDGNVAWPVTDYVASIAIGKRPYAVFGNGAAFDLVPAESVKLIGAEVVCVTCNAIRTSWGNLALVTHGDGDLHQDSLSEIFSLPGMAALPVKPSVFRTYYVDADWQVHCVETVQDHKNEPMTQQAIRHKRALKIYQEVFHVDKEKTKEFALARAKNSKVPTGG